MKEKMKNLWRKINLYQKEQCVIGLTLFCFILSGFFLPSVQKQLPDNATKESSTVVHFPSEAQEESTDDTNNSEVTKPDDTPVITPAKTEDKEPENPKEPSKDDSSSSPSKKPEDTSSTEKPKKDSSSTKKPKKNSSTKKPEKAADNSSALDNKNNPPVSEKVWVPPVYETVHHEAVYKTVRVVICNYCKATFNNGSEFQVHKDANGG